MLRASRQGDSGKNGRPDFRDSQRAVALCYGSRRQDTHLLREATCHFVASSDATDFSTEHLAYETGIALWKRRREINRCNSFGSVGV
jgi:hypothetical protein